VKIKVGTLRALIKEALESLPPREEVEKMLQNAKGDRDAAPKVLSLLSRNLPTSSSLIMQGVSRSVQAWVNGKVGWHVVSGALDKLYAGNPKRQSSYAGGLKRGSAA
jgi:hypothetical protein